MTYKAIWANAFTTSQRCENPRFRENGSEPRRRTQTAFSMKSTKSWFHDYIMVEGLLKDSLLAQANGGQMQWILSQACYRLRGCVRRNERQLWSRKRRWNRKILNSRKAKREQGGRTTTAKRNSVPAAWIDQIPESETCEKLYQSMIMKKKTPKSEPISYTSSNHSKVSPINITEQKYWIQIRKAIQSQNIPIKHSVSLKGGIQVHLGRAGDFPKITQILDDGNHQ